MVLLTGLGLKVTDRGGFSGRGASGDAVLGGRSGVLSVAEEVSAIATSEGEQMGGGCSRVKQDAVFQSFGSEIRATVPFDLQTYKVGMVYSDSECLNTPLRGSPQTWRCELVRDTA